MLTVLVAADIHGSKVNLEFPFPVPPSLAEFTRQVELAFGQEVEDRRPAAAPSGFKSTRFQLYDETLARWVDLSSGGQLFDYCQLYAFQPPSPWHKEVRAPIPPPTRARLPVGPVSAPRGLSAGYTPGGYDASPTPRRTVPVSAGPPTNAAGVPLPDNATHDDKVRATFDELDANGNRVIELDEMRRGFQLVNVDFSTATVDDMFGKADTNRNSLIEFAEWQRFAELYPTLLDALYFRFRAYWEDRRAQEHGRELQDQLDRLREGQVAAKTAWEDAQSDSDAQGRQLQAQEQALAATMDQQRRAEEELRDASREVDAATKSVHAHDSEVQLQKEKERQKHAGVLEAQRDTAHAERRVGVAEAEGVRAVDCHRQTLQGRAEAEREVQRQHGLTEAAEADLGGARQRQHAAEAARGQAQREVEEAQAVLAQADADLAARQQAVRELDMDHSAAVQAMQRAAQARQDEERALMEQRDREQGVNMDRLTAERARQEQEQTVARQEQELDAFEQRRRQMEEQEAPLIEQEVRLREQRDSLEEKESKLRSNHRSFYESAWKGGGDQASPHRDRDAGHTPVRW